MAHEARAGKLRRAPGAGTRLSSSMRYGIQKRGPPALPYDTGKALEIAPYPKQPHDEAGMGDQVTGGDDAAHELESVTLHSTFRTIRPTYTCMTQRPQNIAKLKCDVRTCKEWRAAKR